MLHGYTDDTPHGCRKSFGLIGKGCHKVKILILFSLSLLESKYILISEPKYILISESKYILISEQSLRSRLS